MIQGYTQGESDEARQIRAELAQLDRRLQEFPETGIASLRLLRELLLLGPRETVPLSLLA